MTAYISGPVTGMPNRNEEQFEALARKLEAIGFQTMVPTRIVPPSIEWEAAMRICLSAMTKSDIVVVLPGWQDSKGASIEHDVAKQLGIPVFYAEATR